MKNSLSISFLALLFVASCSRDNGTADQAAADYCACMRRNGAPANYAVAWRVCDAELITNYYYYRIEKLDIPLEGTNGKKIPDREKDSALQFFRRFSDLTASQCCKEIFRCGLRSPFDRLTLDSLMRLRQVYPDSNFTEVE